MVRTRHSGDALYGFDDLSKIKKKGTINNKHEEVSLMFLFFEYLNIKHLLNENYPSNENRVLYYKQKCFNFLFIFFTLSY